MTTAIITTPQRGLDKGIVSDTNFIEYPSNSAEEMVNLVTMPDGVVERRPGMHIDHDAYTWTTSTDNNKFSAAYYWEPTPGSRHVIRVNAEILDLDPVITVDDTPIIGGDLLALAINKNVTFSVAYYTQTPVGTGPLVASTASVWFNNDEYETFTAATSTGPGPTFEPRYDDKYYDIGAVRYIRRTTSSYATTVLPAPRGVPDFTQLVQFAAFKNFVVIVSPVGVPVAVWKGPDNLFRCDIIDIVYRRYEDRPDGVGMKEQPGSGVSNALLQENLLNRGWREADITSYKSAESKWPAKTMVPWRGKNSTGVFSSTELNKVFFGSSSAATGALEYQLALDVFTAPSATCVMGGRIWFAGFSGQDMGNAVFFSQPIQHVAYPPTGLARCLSFNDPTAEYFNSPTALDGGYIRIAGAKNIMAVHPFKDGVVVFAENGIWMITGVQGQAFQGNAYDLYKISDEGALTSGGVVLAENFILFVTRTGINRLVANEQTRSVEVVSLTDGRLRDEFSALIGSFTDTASFDDDATPSPGFPYTLSVRNSPAAWGVYDKIEKKAYFGFGQSVATIWQTKSTVGGGFYPLYIANYTPNSSVWVYDVVKDAFLEYVLARPPEYMTTDWSGQHVLFTDEVPYKFSGGATASAGNFQDVSTLTGAWPPVVSTYADYSSYAVISTKNALVDPDKQLSAVHLSFENSNYGTYPSNTDGACYMSVIFDNYTAVDAKRTSPEQQAYRHVPGKEPDYSTGNYYRVVKTRLKVRGHGSHYRIKVRSDGNKNFKLIGYALDVEYPLAELRRISGGGGDE